MPRPSGADKSMMDTICAKSIVMNYSTDAKLAAATTVRARSPSRGDCDACWVAANVAIRKMVRTIVLIITSDV